MSTTRMPTTRRKKMKRLLSESKLPRMASSVKKAMIVMLAVALVGVLVCLFTRLNQGGMR
jgi:uncharacterized protein involved in exopolysaccharide biosynthesis